jgi:hypothetical protein
MPYSVGAKGTHGCSGYPVVKTATGEVMGCHPSVEDANKQLAALHINEPDSMKADSSILPAQPSSTTNSMYPGVGEKYPTQGMANSSRTRGNIKSKYGKKPKINGRGRSGDALNSDGAVASGGSGGSMGTKADDVWSGSAFSSMGCTPGTYKCKDIMCKVCMTKNMEIK